MDLRRAGTAQPGKRLGSPIADCLLLLLLFKTSNTGQELLRAGRRERSVLGSGRLPGAMRNTPPSVRDLRRRPAPHSHRAARRHGPRRRTRLTDTSPTRLRRSDPPHRARRAPPLRSAPLLRRYTRVRAACGADPRDARRREGGGSEDKPTTKQPADLPPSAEPPPERPAGAQCPGPR